MSNQLYRLKDEVKKYRVMKTGSLWEKIGPVEFWQDYGWDLEALEPVVNEQWKPVVGYKKLYEVSNMGNVRSVDRCIERSNGIPQNFKGKPLTHHINRKGYPTISLSKNGKAKTHRVHTLMAKAFLDYKLKKGICVDHINNVRNDNRLENLQVISHRENCSKDKPGLVGCYYDKANKRWKASIKIEGVSRHIGHYKSEEEAHNAYMKVLNQWLQERKNK